MRIPFFRKSGCSSDCPYVCLGVYGLITLVLLQMLYHVYVQCRLFLLGYDTFYSFDRLDIRFNALLLKKITCSIQTVTGGTNATKFRKSSYWRCQPVERHSHFLSTATFYSRVGIADIIEVVNPLTITYSSAIHHHLFTLWNPEQHRENWEGNNKSPEFWHAGS